MIKMNHIALVLVILLCGCSRLPQKTTFTAISEPATIALKARPGQKLIHAIHIRCSGTIDGQAQISLILNGKPYKTEDISGKVSFTWGGDWYSDSAEIQYKPEKVGSGVLNFRYSFKDL